MSIRLSKFVPVVLLLLTSLVSTACSDSNPADVTGPTDAAPLLSLSAEPAVVTPEFLPRIGMCNAPRFRTRFVVILGGIRGVAVTGLFVSFTDFLGFAAVPTVIPAAPFGGTTQISAARIPVPFPASGPADGLSVPTGFPQQVPVTLEFACHVRPRGTIIVSADTRDGRGRMGTSRFSVQVGE
jgi:hypothetical protein